MNKADTKTYRDTWKVYRSKTHADGNRKSRREVLQRTHEWKKKQQHMSKPMVAFAYERKGII